MSASRGREVHLLLSEAEAESLVDLGAAMESMLKDDAPFNTATAKIDEQLAAQTMQAKRWAVDDVEDTLREVVDQLRDQHFDDPRYKEWAERLVDQIVGVYR